MNALLSDCGTALYGQRWQSELARDLGVSDRTVRRWAAGSHPVPADAWPRILRLLQARGTSLLELEMRLRSASKKTLDTVHDMS